MGFPFVMQLVFMKFGRQEFRVNHLCRIQNGQPFDQVLEFAYIPAPVMCKQNINRFQCKLDRLASLGLCLFIGKMFDQFDDVVPRSRRAGISMVMTFNR